VIAINKQKIVKVAVLVGLFALVVLTEVLAS